MYSDPCFHAPGPVGRIKRCRSFVLAIEILGWKECRTMLPYKKALFLAAVLAMVALPNVGYASSNPCSLSSDILLQIIKIAYTKNSLEKGIEARLVNQTISRLPANERDKMSGEIVDALISMLSEDNKTVKIYAALSLEAFGARSEKALPALEDALVFFKQLPPSSQVSFDPVDGAFEISAVIDEIKKASSKRR